ncbi:hypothetical protein K0U83_20890 [bacterium]|nr:hypothetical protein [bacterium]
MVSKRFKYLRPRPSLESGGPRAQMTGDVACPSNQATIQVTITFPEDVTPALSDAMLVKDNCTTANFTQTVAVNTWTVDVTASSEGGHSLEVPAGVVTGVTSGLPNRRSVWSCVYDATNPTPTITGPSTVVAGTPFDTVTTFDEAVTGTIDASSYTVTGGTIDAVVQNGSTATVTGTPTAEGTPFTLQFKASIVTDAAGNPNDASTVYTATVVGAPTQPVPTISGTASSPDQTWTLTVDFDQDVNDGELAVGDFTTTGGYTVSSIVKVTASQYTFDVTGGVIDVPGTVTLNAGAVTAVFGGLSSVVSNTYAIEWISFTPETLSQDLLQWCGA